MRPPIRSHLKASAPVSRIVRRHKQEKGANRQKGQERSLHSESWALPQFQANLSLQGAQRPEDLAGRSESWATRCVGLTDFTAASPSSLKIKEGWAVLSSLVLNAPVFGFDGPAGLSPRPRGLLPAPWPLRGAMAYRLRDWFPAGPSAAGSLCRSRPGPIGSLFTSTYSTSASAEVASN